MSYKGNQERRVSNGIVVTCANGGQLTSTATDVLNYQGLPAAATPCHKFPDDQLVDPLLSLGKLATHGCRIVFAGDKVTVTNPAGTVALIGRKPCNRNVYTVPLPLGRAPPPPTVSIPTPAPKISGMMMQNNANSIVVTNQSMMMSVQKKNTNVPSQKRETTTKLKKNTNVSLAQKHTENDIFRPKKHKNGHNSVKNGVRGILRAVLETTVSPTPRKKVTKNTLPPPRPGKLFIPVPKCQHISPHTDNLRLTTDEVEKYCNWVKADTITKGATIKEASLVAPPQLARDHCANAAAGYTPRAIPDLINYYHAAAGFPIKTTWLRAIKKGYYIGWPGLTVDRVQTHLNPKIETALGHMHKVRQGVKTTQIDKQGESPQKQDAQHDLRIHTIRTDTQSKVPSPQIDSKS